MTTDQNLNMVDMTLIYLDHRAQTAIMGVPGNVPAFNEVAKNAANNDVVRGVATLKAFVAENNIPVEHISKELLGCAYIRSWLRDNDRETFYKFTR